MKVDVENFMTYAKAVIEPGPRLNLVLGPNGTGKSSLVCAICIGLAGGQKLLGRAENVSSFVRRGCTHGSVQITLSNGPGQRPIVVKRAIKSADNSSEWHLNGQQVHMRTVVDHIKALNIQLDNLCQFLPQDKVVEFAKLKPVDLLHATELAVGDGHLEENHKELISMKDELRHTEAAVEAKSRALERLKEENDRNERTVAQLRKRDALLKEIEDMELKKHWLMYGEKQREFDAEQKKLTDFKKKLAHAKKHGENNKELEKKKKERELLKRNVDAIKGKPKEIEVELITGVDGGHHALTAVLEDLNKAIRKTSDELSGLDRKYEMWEKKKEKHRKTIESLSVKLSELPEDTGDPPGKRKLQAKMNDLHQQRTSSEHEKSEADHALNVLEGERGNLMHRLSRLEDPRNHRLSFLERNSRGITAAAEWLRNNQSMFRGRVYGPIAITVDVPVREHVKYLEGAVPQNTWRMFVTENREDQDLLDRCLKEQCNYSASISNYTGNASASIPCLCGNPREYARFGVVGTLNDVYTAPPLIKHVLNDMHYLGSHLVGGVETAQQYDRMMREAPAVRTLWTPQHKYDKRTSKYNQSAVSTMITNVKEPVFLGGNAGLAEVDAARNHFQTEITQKDREIQAARGKLETCTRHFAEVETRYNAAAAELKEMDKNRSRLLQERKGVELQVNVARKELEKVESKHDPRKKRPELEKELKSLKQQAFNCAKKIRRKVEELVTANMVLTHAQLALFESKKQLEILIQANADAQKTVTDYECHIQQMETLVHNMKRDALKAKADAERATDGPLTDELNAKFDKLPNDLQGLQDMMLNKRADANDLQITDPGALELYERRCREIVVLEGELVNLNQDAAEYTGKIVTLKETWLAELKQIITEVDRNFSVNFQKVGCAGEVALREAPNDNFANFAIEIRVKFRENENLSCLDASRQSGGERSVSTMLYLVALQGVTVTPFRVVDEINQGMDAVNERKIFKQLVEAATQPGTPQCFLLTPKLLPDLPFSRDVTVLQIMNGPLIREVADRFDMQKVLGSRAVSASA